jgi:ribosomal protein S18 acetylase RimI-like enzyme
MTIRPAEPSDHPALAELFLVARNDAFTWADPASHTRDDFADQTEGEAIHLAESSEGELLGFISIWEEENFVHHLFVSPAQQGKGVGRALLADLASRRAGPFTLKCVAANSAALAFYRKTGWREIGSGTVSEGRYLLMEWLPARHFLIERRPGTPDDLDFLWKLHVLTMQEYAGRTWGWDSMWQEERFREQFDPQRLEILEIGGKPIGMISVVEEADHVFLRVIEIHPDWQNRGIGRQLVLQVLQLAREKGAPARLQVLKVNPARHLYERCGFRVTGKTETHFLMEHFVDE